MDSDALAGLFVLIFGGVAATFGLFVLGRGVLQSGPRILIDRRTVLTSRFGRDRYATGALRSIRRRRLTLPDHFRLHGSAQHLHPDREAQVR